MIDVLVILIVFMGNINVFVVMIGECGVWFFFVG